MVDWTYVLVAVVAAAIPSIFLLRKTNIEISEISSRVYQDVIEELEKKLKRKDMEWETERQEIENAHEKDRKRWRKERAALLATIAELRDRIIDLEQQVSGVKETANEVKKTTDELKLKNT